MVAAFLSAGGVPAPLPEIDVPSFLAAAAAEGLLGLVYARLTASGAAADLPPALLDGVRAGAHRQAALELAQRAELQRIVAAARGRGVDVLLMKGASLAYDVYPSPAWRVRSDTDIFIRERDRTSVRACLDGLGYTSAPEVSGRFVTYQFHSERVDDRRLRHLCDVHWKITNPQRFADAVGFDELAGAAIPLPELGPGARGFGRAHALWLACVHRAAHHYDQDTLVWLYDVHLLIGKLDAAGFEQFLALAHRTGVRRICLRALQLAAVRFGTQVQPAVLGALNAPPEHEPSAIFLGAGVRKIDVLLDDLRALPGWRSRLALIREHLFPGPAYMRGTYATGSSAPAAWLYFRRIVRGASKWLRP